MAPFLDAADDFVLTISDDDTQILTPDEGLDDTLPISITSSKNGKKRKREGDNSSRDQKKKAKRTKLKQAGLENNLLVETEIADKDDGSWVAGDHDDTAIDSDFEFQIGEVDTGVFEDFDGWGMNGGSIGSTSRGGKTGVDIDELIARRRNSQNGPRAEKGDVGHTESSKKNDHDEDRENQDVSEADIDREEIEELGNEENEEGVKEDEEELLAPDGFGMGATGSDEEDCDVGLSAQDNDLNENSASEDESVASPVSHPEDLASDTSSIDEVDDPTEKARREAFFAPEEKKTKSASKHDLSLHSFQNMSLSRPILRGLASVGFSEPTPIQVKTIPVALLGKDVVGGAVTGSGKTAAFMIPILERLLYRPKKIPTSRVAILMPTRELAIQCLNVAKKLASFTDVTFCQLVGGFSLREQENVLRSRPDVIIATPGRFIDHMRNSASFTLDTLEILVLDEADRMLEDGFADELNEILTTIPKSRQTMLFSATMTDSVDKLIRVGLNRPVRLLVDARKQTVGTLVQEFIRLRPGREDKRLAYLMYLCATVYTDRVIIFFRQKREAHRVRIIFGLCGFKAAELHGSMSQEQRILSIESFRSAAVTHLLATDVASRGLDIKGVETVINYEAPQSHEIYLHRVGRTARAGRSGRSCTIAAEPDRKVVKAAVKSGKAQGAKIVSRVVEPTLIDEWAKRIADMEEEVEAVMQEEKEEKQLSQVEMQVRKGENIIDHESEIMSRPKRTWFESEKEKRIAKKTGRAELNGPESVAVKKGKRKLSGKDKKRLDDSRERVQGKVWKKGKTDRSGGGGLGGGLKGDKAGRTMKKGRR